MKNEPFIPIDNQYFASQQQWINQAHWQLTSHPKFRRGYFEALCFDQKFRNILDGGGFQKAEDENAFPVFWVWPDQWAQIFQRINELKPNVWWHAEDGEFGFSDIDLAVEDNAPHEIVEVQQGIILENQNVFMVKDLENNIHKFNTDEEAEAFVKADQESEGAA